MRFPSFNPFAGVRRRNRKDSAMPEQTTNPEAPDVKALIAEAMTNLKTEILDSVKTTVTGTVTEAVKPIADQVAAIKPGDGLNSEAVAKIVGDQLDARLKAAAASDQAKAARQATIDKIVKEKLGGNANLGKLLTGQTDEELTAQADLIAAEAKALKPDFGAASKDGGTTPNQTASPAANALNGLTPGVAKFAESIKLPTQGSAAAPGSAATDTKTTEAAK